MDILVDPLKSETLIKETWILLAYWKLWSIGKAKYYVVVSN